MTVYLREAKCQSRVSTVTRQKHLFDQDELVLISCCTMISEMGGFAWAQAVDAMLNSQYVNIAWDAMTLNGVHINK